jgi:peptidyl-prolyl cis-trans isomerase D
MLQFMRKHAQSWLIKLLLGLIIVVFVLYFGSSRWREPAESLVTIGDRMITFSDYRKEYQNLLDMYRQRLGQNLTEEVVKSLNLKQQALDNLINQTVLLTKAEEMGIRVSDEEVQAIIAIQPAFQRDGVFDPKRYEQLLRYQKMSPEEFEALQKKAIMAAKVQDIFRQGVKVSEKELQDLYRLQSERINVELFKLPARACRGKVSASKEDLEKYYNDHKDEFRIPARVQVKAIVFPAEDYARKTEVSEAEVRSTYEANKSRLPQVKGAPPSFDSVKGRIAEEIRLMKAMGFAAEEAKKAHDTIYQEENFEAYAAKHGLRVQERGFFSAKDMPAELKQIRDVENQLFSLRVDEVTSVLSSPRAYYLIKIVAKKDASSPSFEEVKKDVEERYATAESLTVCRKEAEAALVQLRKGEDFRKVAREKGAEVVETGFFSPGSEIPKVGMSQDLINAVFQLSEKAPYPSEVYATNDGTIVIPRFKDRKRVDDGSWEKQKDMIKIILLKAKEAESFQAWLKDVRETMEKEGKIKMSENVNKL